VLGERTVWRLPDADGTTGEVLTTDGRKQLYWSGGGGSSGITVIPWHESWDITLESTEEVGVNLLNRVYWHGFWCSLSGVYHTIRVRVRRYLDTPVQDFTMWGNVYSSNGNATIPSPVEALGTDGDILITFPADDTYFEIPIGNVTLSANTIYFVALKWTGGNDDDLNLYATSDVGETIENSMLWASTDIYDASGLPPAPESTDISNAVPAAAMAGFWFQIYGDNFSLQGSTGPTGGIGATDHAARERRDRQENPVTSG